MNREKERNFSYPLNLLALPLEKNVKKLMLRHLCGENKHRKKVTLNTWYELNILKIITLEKLGNIPLLQLWPHDTIHFVEFTQCSSAGSGI
ncbi:hypothetical protein BACI349Y_100204 [Bacillus sp. 349Y]|nr:hypothetical protein BACI349Y_100204 [Bacillus sp. 349Y]